jgi:hypothetical protein
MIFTRHQLSRTHVYPVLTPAAEKLPMIEKELQEIEKELQEIEIGMAKLFAQEEIITQSGIQIFHE